MKHVQQLEMTSDLAGWGSWASWTSCSVTCGSSRGTKTRIRYCSTRGECTGSARGSTSCYSNSPCPGILLSIFRMYLGLGGSHSTTEQSRHFATSNRPHLYISKSPVEGTLRARTLGVLRAPTSLGSTQPTRSVNGPSQLKRDTESLSASPTSRFACWLFTKIQCCNMALFCILAGV